MKLLKASEKKKLVNELDENFGIDKLNYILVETGKQKVRGFSGSMTKEEIIELGKIANVEIVGLYLAKKDEKFGLRLSLDGTIVLKNQISENVVEINDEQLDDWFLGKSLELSGLDINLPTQLSNKKTSEGESYDRDDNFYFNNGKSDSRLVKDSSYDNKSAKDDGYSNLEVGMVVIKHKKTGDFLGCGFSDGKKLINYVPKERRVRKS